MLCTKNTDNTILNHSDTVQVAVNNCINIIKNNNNIQICLDSVMDSRCPADVTCIWQGIGIVKLKCTINNQIYPFKLGTYTYQNISSDTIINGFHIKLLELSPYPVQNNPQPYTNYQAKILVSY
jgi:hypothetical protein